MLMRPYRRTWRPGVQNPDTLSYISHPLYASNAIQYYRSFLIITEDVKNIIEYIEPDEINLKSYSFRIHSLFLRISIEVEANLRAILIDNKLSQYEYRIPDYHLVDVSHKLSGYRFQVVRWKGDHGRFVPFGEWSSSHKLSWYQNYNLVKHDRQENFRLANFENLITSYCGLCALIWSQFNTVDFTMHTRWGSATDNMGYQPMTGDIVTILPPDRSSFEEHEFYGFSYDDWNKIQAEEIDPFKNFDYHAISLSRKKAAKTLRDNTSK